MSFQDRANGYFDQHPTENEFHFTSDGQAFITKEDAEMHCKSLDKKDIQTIKRNGEPAVVIEPLPIQLPDVAKSFSAAADAAVHFSAAATETIKENKAKSESKKAAPKKADKA